MTKTLSAKLPSAALLSLLAAAGCSNDRAKVAFVSPMGLSGSPIVSVSVMFDREVVSDLDLGEELARGPFQLTPAVRGTFRWEHPDEVVFTTTEALAEGQTYKVRIDSSVIAEDGVRLDDYDWTFEWNRAAEAHSRPALDLGAPDAGEGSSDGAVNPDAGPDANPDANPDAKFEEEEGC